MTAVLDCNTDIMRRLITSCYQAQAGFRSASEAVSDASLRRLFDIYAQQRIRFAEELREHLPERADRETAREEPSSAEVEQELSSGDELRECLDREATNLALYERALLERALPTRAHFLVSAQYSLMQRAHERMNALFRHADVASQARDRVMNYEQDD